MTDGATTATPRAWPRRVAVVAGLAVVLGGAVVLQSLARRAEVTVPIPVGELADDPSAELRSTRWVLTGGAVVSTDAAHSGKRAWRIPAGGRIASSIPIPALPGVGYRFEAWVRTTDPAPRGRNVALSVATEGSCQPAITTTRYDGLGVEFARLAATLEPVSDGCSLLVAVEAEDLAVVVDDVSLRPSRLADSSFERTISGWTGKGRAGMHAAAVDGAAVMRLAPGDTTTQVFGLHPVSEPVVARLSFAVRSERVDEAAAVTATIDGPCLAEPATSVVVPGVQWSWPVLATAPTTPEGSPGCRLTVSFRNTGRSSVLLDSTSLDLASA